MYIFRSAYSCNNITFNSIASLELINHYFAPNYKGRPNYKYIITLRTNRSEKKPKFNGDYLVVDMTIMMHLQPGPQ